MNKRVLGLYLLASFLAVAAMAQSRSAPEEQSKARSKKMSRSQLRSQERVEKRRRARQLKKEQHDQSAKIKREEQEANLDMKAQEQEDRKLQKKEKILDNQRIIQARKDRATLVPRSLARSQERAAKYKRARQEEKERRKQEADIKLQEKREEQEARLEIKAQEREENLRAKEAKNLERQRVIEARKERAARVPRSFARSKEKAKELAAARVERHERRVLERAKEEQEFEYGESATSAEKARLRKLKRQARRAREERNYTRSEAEEYGSPVIHKHVRSEEEEYGQSARAIERAKQREIAHRERLARKKIEREERKLQAKLESKERVRSRAQRLIDFANRAELRHEEKVVQRAELAEHNKQLWFNEQKRVQDQVDKLAFANQVQTEGKKRWKELHQLEIDRDYEAGRYAHVSNSPYEWPYPCSSFNNKDHVEVLTNYQYATDAYSSNRSRVDVSALALGYEPFTLKDISLASNLVSSGVLQYIGTPALQAGVAAAADGAGAHTAVAIAAYASAVKQIAVSGDPSAAAVASVLAHQAYDVTVADAIDLPTAIVINQVVAAALTTSYVNTFATKQLNFNGKTEGYSTTLDYARYILGKNIHIGAQMPIVYRKNTLTCDFPYIQDVLTAKGMSELGGSATGLGDMTMFFNVETGTRTFKKLLSGLKVTFPTGKPASTAKLWAPTLGGGYTQFTAYTGMLMEHSRLLNPHVYVEGVYSMPAHFNKRVPVLVSGSVTKANDASQFTAASVTEQGAITSLLPTGNNTAKLNNTLMAMGDRLQLSTAVDVGGIVAIAAPMNTTTQLFSTFDSTVSAFADNIFSVKMIPGLAFNIMMGNIIEKVLFRQGMLGITYTLNAKFSDAARGLDTLNYNVASLGTNTAMVAHKIGASYLYEFDAQSSCGLSATYTFAGINAPKVFEINALLGYSW